FRTYVLADAVAPSFALAVNLSAPATTAIVVPFTLSGTAVLGVNYTGLTSSPLIIPAGQTTALITGYVIDDGDFIVASPTLFVTLGTPSGATLGSMSTEALGILE